MVNWTHTHTRENRNSSATTTEWTATKKRNTICNGNMYRTRISLKQLALSPHMVDACWLASSHLFFFFFFLVVYSHIWAPQKCFVRLVGGVAAMDGKGMYLTHTYWMHAVYLRYPWLFFFHKRIPCYAKDTEGIIKI